MPTRLRLAIAIFSTLLLSPSLAYANTEASGSAQVSASVQEAPPTQDNQAPTPPILLRPANGSLTGDSTPEFVWRMSSDPDGNTVYYDLYLDGVATFLGISNLGNSSGTGYSATIQDGELRLIPTFELSEGEHTWLVRAYDVNTASSSSAQWSLTIDLTPPWITLTDIDSYHNLGFDSRNPSSVPPNTNLEISGPKDIYFTLSTEPYATLQLAIYNTANQLIYHSSNLAPSSPIYPYTHLDKGRYLVSVVAIDGANHATTLPNFYLTVTTATLPLPNLSPLPIPSELVIPNLPPIPPGYTATISRIATRDSLAVYLIILLALAILLLIILLKRRRYNLALISQDGKSLSHATVFHSKPDIKTTNNPLLLTRREPFRYTLEPDMEGKLYIPRLNRYSTLTIRTDSSLTIISVNRYHSPLTLVIE